VSQQQELLDDAKSFGWQVSYRYTNPQGELSYRAVKPGRENSLLFFFAPLTGRLTYAKKMFQAKSSQNEGTPVFSTALGWID
jgi:hypothetical protein